MKKRFLALFIVVVMLLSQATIFATDLNISSASSNPEDKLTDELKEVMSNTPDDEYIPIYIWLTEIEDSYIYEEISKRFEETINQVNEEQVIASRVEEKVGLYNKIKDIDDTKNESKGKLNFQNNIENEIKVFRNNKIVSDIISDDKLTELIQNNVDVEKIITISEYNLYLNEWREARKEANNEIVFMFKNSLDQNRCNNVYENTLLGYITLQCQKSYICSLSLTPVVEKIGLFENSVFIDLVNNDVVEFYETQPTGYHMIQENFSNAYTGLGVNVGVLELANFVNGKYEVNYDSSNVHLTNKTGKIYTRHDPSISENMISENPKLHATYVLTMLCGNLVQSVNGQYYQGVAPDATVYYATSKGSTANIYESLEWLIINGNVSVINMSFVNENSDTYDTFCQYIDCLIQQYRVTFVIAAGNGGQNVLSPGIAHNAITVGNETYTVNESGQYITNESSSYKQKAKYANKPDIVAFGTNLYTLNSEFTPSCKYGTGNQNVTGTSFSAPIVSGTVALMIQANSALEANPIKIKSVILTSANDEQVDREDSNNSERNNAPVFSSSYMYSVGGIVREKTGAGILNVKASVVNANDALTWTFSFASNGSASSKEYYISAGTLFKIGIAFEKNDHDLVSTQTPNSTKIDVEMIDVNTGERVFSSEESETNGNSSYDNVKVFDIITNRSGTFVFRLKCVSVDLTDEDGTVLPSLHENTHSNIKATLSLTCSCLNPNVLSTDIDHVGDSTAKMVYCNSIGCFHTIITEIKYHASIEKNESFGSVIHSVSYARGYVSSHSTIKESSVNIAIELNNPNQTYRVDRGNNSIEYNQNGYIECYRYEVYVFNSSGGLVGIYEISVNVVYDNMTASIYLY